MKKLKIGLFGFGCVGEGLYDVIHKTKGIDAEIVKICVKSADKPRSIDKKHFTIDKNELLQHPDINVIVELIDDAEAAYDIVTTALKSGKAVVSANKKLIANHFEELFALQRKHNVPFLYEASVCGAIPIIRNLEEYYNSDFVDSIETICNGTTNYILTKTIQEKRTYNEVLREAQKLGFAESDPTLDVQGFDSKYKLVILTAHTFGKFVKPEKVLNYGIHHLNLADTQFAQKQGYSIKLLAKATRQNGHVTAYVAPHFIKADNQFYNVHNEYNAVQLGALFAEKQFFVGKGAGSHPTASAVLSDIAALTYDYKYEYKKANLNDSIDFNPNALRKVYVRYTTPSAIADLNFSTIHQKHESHEFNYIIGSISIANLLAADLNEREDVFMCFFE